MGWRYVKTMVGGANIMKIKNYINCALEFGFSGLKQDKIVDDKQIDHPITKIVDNFNITRPVVLGAYREFQKKTLPLIMNSTGDDRGIRLKLFVSTNKEIASNHIGIQ